MATLKYEYGTEGVVSSVTVKVTPGTEPELGIGVNLAGQPSVNARGVVINSRDGYITVALLGQVPLRLAQGNTVVAGQPVSINANGQAVSGVTGKDVIGIALESTTASDNYEHFVEVLLNPQPFIPAV